MLRRAMARQTHRLVRGRYSLVRRWYDKGKPVGTHKGYDGKDNIAWTLRFDDGKPNIGDVDCFCVVCQLAFLYGTASWNKTNPFNEDCTLFFASQRPIEVRSPTRSSCGCWASLKNGMTCFHRKTKWIGCTAAKPDRDMPGGEVQHPAKYDANESQRSSKVLKTHVCQTDFLNPGSGRRSNLMP